MTAAGWYRVESFSGHPMELIDQLTGLGIKLCNYTSFVSTLEYVRNGEKVREVGELTYQPDNGKVGVWPRSNATDAEIVLLIRSAERALIGAGSVETWSVVTNDLNGRDYRMETILVPLDCAGRRKSGHGHGVPEEIRVEVKRTVSKAVSA